MLLDLLNRLPRRLRRQAQRTLAGRGALGRLLDPLLAGPRAEAPVLPVWGASEVRVVIGPANEVEQGFQWSRALERAQPGVVEARSIRLLGPDPYGARVDVDVPRAVARRDRAWAARLEAWLVGATHVIDESGLPLLGSRSDAADQLQRLRAQGVRVGVMFHGTDVRSPSEHAVRHAHSPFRDAAVPARWLGDRAEGNRRLAAELGLPSFVSTPDLLADVPEAVWCPVVIEPGRWRAQRSDARAWHGDRPVVAHAPSNPAMKGSALIEPVLRRLAEEGVIDYRRIERRPYAEMPAVYAAADIVLDQFVIGAYGAVSIEAMAAGCVALAHVDEASRARVLAETGRALPVLEATVDSLESVLREVAGWDSATAGSRRADGIAFVDTVHDGAFSARQLSSFLAGDDPH